MNNSLSKLKPTYWNSYVAGVLLGLVLLASFVIAGQGIGASGITSQTLAHGYEAANLNSDYLKSQKSEDKLFNTWIVIEVIGIFFGAFISARQSGRHKKEMIKGLGISNKRRIIMALTGGIIMGFAARLARGCTSGQALSGGALLSVGSWVFMLAVFVGAYITIIFFKRSWL